MANSALVEFTGLEPRQLFSTINVTNFGASTGGADSRAAVQTALNNAQPGDTVVFPAGNFSIQGGLQVPTGVTVTGAGFNLTHITFTLAQSGYGFNLDANDSNVVIEGMDVVSNYGFVNMGAGNAFSNISIVGNSVQVGNGEDNDTWGAGINGSAPCNNLTIEYNYFHDGPTGVRMFYLWQPTISRVDYNLFYNVWDCGQVAAAATPGDVFDYSYNYGTSIVNKGLEMQSQYPGEVGKAYVTKNVFYDWLNPSEDTFGMSVVPNQSHGSVVEGNYLAATTAPGSAPVNDHWGYGVEFGSVNSLARDNTIVGPWGNWAGVGDFGYSASNTRFDNNDLYGVANGTFPFQYEPGPNPSVNIGGGSLANLFDPNVNDAPPPPANTFAGPTFWEQTSSTPAPASAASRTSAPPPTPPPSPSPSQSATSTTAEQRLEDISQFRSSK